MTDKKFTDEEIIKALECHINAEDCVGCEMFGQCDEIILTKLVLDFINRQKAEIEELKNYVNRCKSGEEYWVKCLLEKPNEAVKDFAKKLKEEIRLEDDCDYNCRECCYECNDYVIAIDNLLKEMVGEEE